MYLKWEVSPGIIEHNVCDPIVFQKCIYVRLMVLEKITFKNRIKRFA